MEKYWKICVDSFTGYWNYLFNEVSQPGIHNYFYWLLGLSVLVFMEGKGNGRHGARKSAFGHKKRPQIIEPLLYKVHLNITVSRNQD